MISAAGDELKITVKFPVAASKLPVPSPLKFPLASELITAVPLCTLNVAAFITAEAWSGAMLETKVS